MTIKTNDFFSEWLCDEKLELSLSTYETHVTYFERHISPFFSQRREYLSDITPRDVRDFTNHLKTNGRIDGKGGLSPCSVRKLLALLKQSLNEAVILGYIDKNPASYIKLKKQTTTSQRCVMLSSTDAQKLLDSFKGHYLYPIVLIGLYYGLRRSEIIGLKWSAIDFNNNTMLINHTVVKCRTIQAKDSTKTNLSTAEYYLLPDVKEVLLSLKEKSNNSSEYVFTWEDGRRYRPDSVTKTFRNHLVKHGLPPMRLHDLRHSCASILFDKGYSLEDVKNWLRHSDIETTSNIYLHYNMSRRRLIIDGLNGTFKL